MDVEEVDKIFEAESGAGLNLLVLRTVVLS